MSVTGTVTAADPQDNAARARRLFPRLDWHELWADDAEDEWIHEPLLPARRLVSLYSAPKVGKSLLMLELAVGISRGEEVLGYLPRKRWRVLYVDFENDPRGDVRSRLQAMGYGPDDLDHLDYLSFPTMTGLDSARGGLELLEAVKAYSSEVVVIDTVSRAVAGEENSNDTWLSFYRHTGLLLKQAEVAMIRLDHSGKDETRGTRGGSAKSGDVDAIWRLTRATDDRLLLECTDSRMQMSTKSLQLTRHRIPRLHHTVDTFSAETDLEARIIHLVKLADSNGLPADANRDAIRDLAKSRGMAARTTVYAEVVKRRKTVPDLGNSSPQTNCSGPREQRGTEDPALSTEHLFPDDGNSREQVTRSNCSRPPHPIGGDSGNSGTEPPADELREHVETLGGKCSTCHRLICVCEARP
jgi:hypothetical protein